MPTYEYACKECGEHLEVVQSFKDDPLTECPTCHGQLRKVFSAAGLIFKGSGWHIKDYSSSARASAPAPGGDTTPTSDKSTTSSGDTSARSSSDAPGSGGSSDGSASSSSGKASGKPAAPAASSTEKKSA
jgi:putative FmdB family regulatory protein